MDNSVHKIYHKFEKFLEKELGAAINRTGPEVCGYEAIEKIEAYAKANPQIKIVPCDDVMFSGSILVLVPHPKMGITVMFVPQLTTYTNQFFLYPNHQAALLEALAEMKIK